MRQALVASSVAFLLSGPIFLSHSLVPVSSSHLGLPTLSLSCPLMPALLSCPKLPTPLSSRPPVPVLLSCPRLPTLSLFCSFVLALLFCLLILTLLSYLLVPVFLSPSILALLSPPMPALASYSVLGLAPTWFISSAPKTFKRALSNEPLGRRSTNPNLPEPFCLFPILGLLLEKSNCKQFFDTIFINSHLLITNYIVKEIDLSFGKCRHFTPVKLNRLWQLELLDYKLVCIIKAVFLVAAIFWDPLFILYSRYIIKLASKLDLKM